MRSYLVAAGMVCLAAAPLAAQPGRNHLWRTYDELEDCTTVLTTVFSQKPSRVGALFELEAFAMHRSKEPAEAFREVAFQFTAEHDADVGPFHEADLTLLVDDSLRLEYPGRQARPFPSRALPGGTIERAYFRIPIADMQRIARATRVEGSAGTAAFALEPGQIAILRQLADYVARAPGAVVPRWSRQPFTDCDSFPWSPNHPPYEPPKPSAGLGQPAAPSRSRPLVASHTGSDD